MKDAIGETWRIVSSGVFQDRVAAVENMTERVCCSPIDGKAVIHAYLHEQRPITYEPGKQPRQTASTGTNRRTASMSLGVDNLQRWPHPIDRTLTKDEHLRRGCMINTLAHEWTHAIPNDEGETRFQDDGHTQSPRPLVSYTVGSIAHCVYLEREHVIANHQFWPCVEAVGTRVFNGLTVCEDDDWLTRL